MSESDKKFTGSIPEFYDTYLVPLIFEEYAIDLARRVVALSPNNLLETAAGSGVVARALEPLLASHSNYVVSDLNQPMLDHAAAKQPPQSRITWQQADALDLPFEHSRFDVAFCQYGVMFYPDRDKGYTEIHRVLRPGGSFIFNVWDKIEENKFAELVTRAAAEVFPDDPPQFLARTPHGYHDVGLIRQELLAAGFNDISIETLEKTSIAPSARHPAIAYCQGTPLRNEIEARDHSLLEYVTDQAANAIAADYGSGPVRAKIQAHVISATR